MRIAIVGTGIAGLVAADRLHRDHEISVFEARSRLGGHTNTIDVEQDGRTYAVDTGFIVYNERTYPEFTRLLARLGVATQPTTMSFSLKCARTGLEYNGTTLNGLFAQRRNLLRPSFWRMLRDIFRFNRTATDVLRPDAPPLTLGEYLREHRYSEEFVEHYLVPMGAAIWSTDPRRFRDIPVRFFVRFFDNHGMLTVDDRPQWRVVRGGSRNYVEALTRPFRDRLRLATPVESVERLPTHVEVKPKGGPPERFDEIVLATHSDQALRMLQDPTPAERAILGALPYQRNEALLHTDSRILPKKRIAHAAWNYHRPRGERPSVAVTYHMNRLQSLSSRRPFLVTLNPAPGEIDPARILRRIVYHHPLFTSAGIAAQARWGEISGANRTHYCGAYWGFGFHEDGVRSALRAVERIGAPACA